MDKEDLIKAFWFWWNMMVKRCQIRVFEIENDGYDIDYVCSECGEDLCINADVQSEDEMELTYLLAKSMKGKFKCEKCKESENT